MSYISEMFYTKRLTFKICNLFESGFCIEDVRLLKTHIKLPEMFDNHCYYSNTVYLNVLATFACTWV